VAALAAGAGYRLVRGKGRVVGKHDWGRFGVEDARTGHKVFGWGNRGVTARLEEVERFLMGGDAKIFEASLRASKPRRRAARPPFAP
jgi:hypothetical protein